MRRFARLFLLAVVLLSTTGAPVHAAYQPAAPANPAPRLVIFEGFYNPG